jgi:hypothetical protein
MIDPVEDDYRMRRYACQSVCARMDGEKEACVCVWVCISHPEMHAHERGFGGSHTMGMLFIAMHVAWRACSGNFVHLTLVMVMKAPRIQHTGERAG